MIKLKLLLPFILVVGQVTAQVKTTVELSRAPDLSSKIKSLKIGEKVPSFVIPKIINYPSGSANTADFKDKLLILDFWDTFCTSCITALPKLDTMQRLFKNRIKILPVTWQKELVVKNFFKNNRFVKEHNINLPCVVEDKLLRAYFKHMLVSHVVWIYKGEVRAITTTEYINKNNIQAVLEDKEINWPVKNDSFKFDPKQPIFGLNNPEQYNDKSNFLSYSGISGYREGIDYKSGLSFEDDSVKNRYRTFFYNCPIPAAYTMLWVQLEPKAFLVNQSRMILEVSDPAKYIYDPSKGYRDIWDRERNICFEMLNTKRQTKKERCLQAINQLNLHLNLDGRFEKRKVKCLVIVKKADVSSVSLQDTISIKDGSKMNLGSLAFFMDMSNKFPPVIDESNSTELVTINSVSDLVEVRKRLAIYGFSIVDAERELEMLIITEKNFKLNIKTGQRI